jgi:hypothetical protein
MNRNALNELANVVNGLKSLVNKAIASDSAESFETLSQQFGRLESSLRERHQLELRERSKAAIARLQKKSPLSGEDEAVIRALVVGDAEFYLKNENNLKDWLNELERLGGEMQRLAGDASEAGLANLRGVVKDAVRLVPNIRNYMEEKARLDRFNHALANLDDDNRELLVKLLREMQESPTR